MQEAWSPKRRQALLGPQGDGSQGFSVTSVSSNRIKFRIKKKITSFHRGLGWHRSTHFSWVRKQSLDCHDNRWYTCSWDCDWRHCIQHCVRRHQDRDRRICCWGTQDYRNNQSSVRTRDDNHSKDRHDIQAGRRNFLHRIGRSDHRVMDYRDLLVPGL